MWVHTGAFAILHLSLFSSEYGTSAALMSPNPEDPNYTIERLPKNVKPQHYTLNLQVNLPGYVNMSKEEEFTTYGVVEIEFSVSELTKVVKLNVANTLTIKEVLFTTITPTLENSNWTKLHNFSVDENVDVMTIQLEDNLLLGSSYYMKIIYDGVIIDKAYGLFYETQEGIDGIEYSAVTQFEDMYARRMVPCFDEPTFKATWKVRIIHPLGTNAISNGQLLERIVSGEESYIISIFDDSPYMSSYLLAIAVGSYVHETGYTHTGIEVRGFARKSLGGKALKDAVFYTIKSMEILEDTFNYSPFEKKLDFVFSSKKLGGMENWGLIIYGDHMLSTDLHKLSNGAINIIAHEVIHQADDCLFRMQEYSMSTSQYRKLEVEVIERLQVVQVYGSAYQKGGALARMLEEIVGYPHMVEGLKKYIHDNSYGNVNRHDLVSALQLFTDVNLTRLVDQWTNQVGYPILHVDQIADNTFKLTQTVVAHNRTRAGKFDIPIFVKNSHSKKIPVLSADDEYLYLTTDGGEYPLINGNNAGGYRVDYGAGWNRVIDNQKLSTMERSKLLNDLHALRLTDQKEGLSSGMLQRSVEPLGQHHDNSRAKEDSFKDKP